jgi:hypothetical protein
MINRLRHIGLVCLAAAFFASPVNAEYHPWSRAGGSCGCGYHAPYVPVRTEARPYVEGYYSHSLPSAVISPSPARTGTRQFPSQYYTPDEARALYHPVVVPLDEFLSPREPVALTPAELARQRAAAEARATPPQPAPSAVAPATTPDADPFADDAPPAGETARAISPSAPADDAEAAPAESAAEETFAEEAMPAEQPEVESPPDAAAPPEAGPADPDPFEDLE